MFENFNLHGNYCQTELGHGSYIAGIETTATFDHKTDEFVLHTPTISATKWWPGGLGRISTHAIVIARLLIPEEEDPADVSDYGVSMFIVQLRDKDTHKHLPGIKTGDMGPKFGYSSQDNGWLQFDHHRVPRDNLLQKFLKVDRDGCVSMSGNPKMIYATLLKTRISLIVPLRHFMHKALLIAIRYSVVRR